MISNTARQTASRIFNEAVARRLLVAVFIFLATIQGFYVFELGQKLTFLTDGFSESNALRAADAYLKDGITLYHGLPRQAYGSRFSDVGYRSTILEKDGSIKAEMRRCLPPDYADANKWVYTHYPEGPDVMLALYGKIVGLENVASLRLFPLALSLIATAFFFFTLARVFGSDRAALIATGCVLLPMFQTCLPGLHYQGYSFALFLIQISLLMRLFWEKGSPKKWLWIVLFLLGFLQGWLSFDQFFVITLIAWPLWLLRKAEGASVSFRQLFLCMLFPFIGFGFAHFLHFLQVAGETGGIQAAITEFRTTATERGGAEVSGQLPDMFRKGILNHAWQATAHSSRLQSLFLGSYQCLRDLLHPACVQFSPTFPLIFLLFLPACLPRSKPSVFSLSFSWPEPRSAFPALWAALAVSSLWLLVMPGHVAGNHHITVRHFFVFYLFLLIFVVKSIQIHADSMQARESALKKS